MPVPKPVFMQPAEFRPPGSPWVFITCKSLLSRHPNFQQRSQLIFFRKTEKFFSLLLLFPPEKHDAAAKTFCYGCQGHVPNAEPNTSFPLHFIAYSDYAGISEVSFLPEGAFVELFISHIPAIGIFLPI